MISIPVYGGDNLEKASANEKQGEAFAILPLGLPQGTSVRLRLWLNSNGIFELTAHLENGTDLKPWIVEKGEANEKAIRAIERVEQLLAQKGDASAPMIARRWNRPAAVSSRKCATRILTARSRMLRTW